MRLSGILLGHSIGLPLWGQYKVVSGCSSFTLSYQDGYRLIKVSTHVDFIVLPNWETRLLVLWPIIPFGKIILALSELKKVCFA